MLISEDLVNEMLDGYGTVLSCLISIFAIEFKEELKFTSYTEGVFWNTCGSGFITNSDLIHICVRNMNTSFLIGKNRAVLQIKIVTLPNDIVTDELIISKGKQMFADITKRGIYIMYTRPKMTYPTNKLINAELSTMQKWWKCEAEFRLLTE